MSDNESSASDQTENSVDQESSSPDREDPSSDNQIDSSTDVAPVRKTRKRPEQKPPPEDQKTPATPPPAETAPKVRINTVLSKGCSKLKHKARYLKK